jgi:alpha-tubulin suppressor-like RCC1 family protein
MKRIIFSLCVSLLISFADVNAEKLYTWGSNTYGQIGDSSTTNRTSPVLIGTGTNWTYIACGELHSVAVKSDGTLWAWGYNLYSRLGDSTTTNRTTPVKIGTATNWVKVNSESAYSIAINSEGKLLAWGLNTYGQLGDGSTTNRTTPKQIGIGTNWSQVDCGENHTVAIKSDGTLWVWGRNNFGQLGDSTTTDKTSPIQIGTGTNWSQIVCSGYDSYYNNGGYTIAVKSDGTLWAWGSNGNGQLGDGSTITRISPVKIGTATNWSKVATNDFHSAAIKTDGSLWAWGTNYNGQLGDGTTTGRTAPVKIGSDTNWSKVYCGSEHTVAVKKDGTLWSWGLNSSGQLGDGSTQSSYSPVLIGVDTNWTQIACGNHTIALNKSPSVPTLSQATINSITNNSASSGGNITYDGGSAVTARGVCWSTSQNPTISGTKTSDGTGSGNFTSNITGLIASTKYYVRAYATNNIGTGYSLQDSLTTSSSTPSKKVKVKIVLNGLWVSDKHLPGVSVCIELRSGSVLISSSVSKSIAAKIDTLGYAEADFGELSDGNYWLLIRAAGYLPVAAPNQVSLSTSGINYDFTTGSDKSVSGTNAMIQPVNPGPWMIRSGDFNNSRSVTATDINNYFLPNNGKNVSSTIPAP